MTDKRVERETILLIIAAAFFALTRFFDFSNADISFAALVTVILALLIAISGNRHHSS